MKQKICSKCRSKPASFFYRETIGGQKKELCLCHDCAIEEGFEKEGEAFSSLFFSPSFFPSAKEERCPICGMSLSQIQKSGKFGCSACFDTFAKKLDLSPFLGGGYFEKKEPSIQKESAPKEESKLEKLKKELREAVAREEYEKAAALRDQIREREAK